MADTLNVYINTDNRVTFRLLDEDDAAITDATGTVKLFDGTTEVLSVSFEHDGSGVYSATIPQADVDEIDGAGYRWVVTGTSTASGSFFGTQAASAREQQLSL